MKNIVFSFVCIVIIALTLIGCSVEDARIKQYCRYDSDCKPGFICADSGVCVPEGSLPQTDGDVELTELTDTEQEQETTSCIDEDTLKNNHSRSSAAVVSIGVYPFLSVCPGADDWYSFEVSKDVKYAFLYLRSLTPYSLGVGGRLYSGSNSDAASHDDEGVVFVAHEIAASEGDITEVKAQVVPETFNPRYPQLNRYHMGIIVAGDFECSNSDESNNSMVEAKPLESGIYKFDLCQDDSADFFKVVLPKRKNLFAVVAVAQPDANAVVELLDSDGVLLQHSVANKLVEFKYPGKANSERTLYITIKQNDINQPVKFQYVLDVNLTYEPPFECTDDGYEPNDTKEQATQIYVPSTLYSLSICPTSSVDWFAFSLEQDKRLLITTTSLDDMQAEFRLSVYSSNGELITESDYSSVSTAIEFEAPSGDFLLKVEASNLTDRGVRYSLSVGGVQ